ncbi:hypothetical protein ACMFMG_007536 [Clarireedia jacksonii]
MLYKNLPSVHSSILASPVPTAIPTSTTTTTLKPAPAITARTNHYIPQLQNLAKDPQASSSSTKPTKVSNGVARPTGTGTSANTPCAPAVAALASGISSNIADQHNELAAVGALGFIIAEQPMNQSTFDAGKASLLDFVTKGIAIRAQNQKIAPAGNAAIPGLATVAKAQMEELNLTMSLNAADLAAANRTLDMLKKDFMGGIVQNMLNLANATGGCTVVAASGMPIPMPMPMPAA